MYDSDLDVYVEFLHLPIRFEEIDTSIQQLKKIDRILQNVLGFSRSELVRAKVPLCKVNFEDCYSRGMLPSREYTFNSCDINVNSPNGVYNSRLFKLLVEYSPRFYEMALVLKYWAKQRALICSERFSSYAFYLLIVFYLQNTNPVVLPTVQQLKQMATERKHVNGIDFSICTNARGISPSTNRATTRALIMGFFNFYRNFQWNSGISTLLGSRVSKSNFPHNAMVCVDPFTGKNVLDTINNETLRLWQNEVAKVDNSITEQNCLTLLTE